MALPLNFPYKSLEPSQQAAYEKRLGRKLSDLEVLLGQLIRFPTPQFGDPWRVVMESKESPLDAEIRKAQQAVEDERLAGMRPAERVLHELEKRRERVKAAEQAQADHEKKLVTFKPLLEHVDKLLDAARFDESYTDQDIAELFNTRQQITTLGGCPIQAKVMFDACVAKAKGKCEVRRKEAEEAREFLKAQQAKQDAAAAHFNEAWGFLVPDETTPETPEVKKAREMLALWKSHEEEVRATGAGNNSPALQQAQLHRIKAAQALQEVEKTAREAVASQSGEPAVTEVA